MHVIQREPQATEESPRWFHRGNDDVLPCPASSQSPRGSAFALRRKLRSLPCSSFSDAIRFAGFASETRVGDSTGYWRTPLNDGDPETPHPHRTYPIPLKPALSLSYSHFPQGFPHVENSAVQNRTRQNVCGKPSFFSTPLFPSENRENKRFSGVFHRFFPLRLLTAKKQSILFYSDRKPPLSGSFKGRRC